MKSLVSRTEQWVLDELARLEQFAAVLIESHSKTAPIVLDGRSAAPR